MGKKIDLTGQKIGRLTVLEEDTRVTSLLSQKMKSNNTSGKRGVCWDKSKNKWVARIGFKKKDFYLGSSKDFKTACRMRDEAEEHLYRDFLEWYSKTYPEDWGKLDKNHKEQNEKRGEEE